MYRIFRPTTMEGLIAMEDVAEEKANKYGSSFLGCITEFCCENDWSTDKQQDQSSSVEVVHDDVSNMHYILITRYFQNDLNTLAFFFSMCSFTHLIYSSVYLPSFYCFCN